ncbi:hypothetical protein AB1A81_10300 [Bdellovibrio bacteriovorus]|uniref:Uncharacterized protein n=1 Tax=Bdellovibrio bacteriovorus (strain ATCC 15356 / DSM 50701 / NCIMB 9529 / HD100) TaxID=264462 RepID=Q6MKX7_BDEBA|nr:hypothetical protein [Bdellovibrio bacteriovorus]CAE80080.1 hypothetical protein predicted by Glimmer/Critica [Bdellovibrio bacteriovorus HD100]
MKLTALVILSMLLPSLYAQAQYRSSEPQYQSRPMPTGPQERRPQPNPRTSRSTLDQDWDRRQDEMIRRQEQIDREMRGRQAPRDIDSQNLMPDGRSWD